MNVRIKSLVFERNAAGVLRTPHWTPRIEVRPLAEGRSYYVFDGMGSVVYPSEPEAVQAAAQHYHEWVMRLLEPL